MAGKWVDVPGKGQRFLTDSGEYRRGDPNAPLAPAARAVKNFFGGIINAPTRFSPEQMRALTAPGVTPQLLTAPVNAAEVMGPPVPARIANAPSAPVLPSPASAGGGGAVSVASSPQERAYQSAKAEAAAMSESDPLFKKYQVAELSKAYNATTDPKEKNRIGLQIWATTNPTLAQKLKPGQTGYQEAASLLGTQTFGTDQPGFTQAALSGMAEKIGASAMESVPEGFVKSFGAVPANFGAGIDAAQVGYSPTGELPPQMIGENVFSLPTELNAPKDLANQLTRRLLIEAYNKRLK